MAWTHTRSEIALAKRRDPNADTTDLHRQLKAERLAERITQDVSSWPELTGEQRAELALLLGGGAG